MNLFLNKSTLIKKMQINKRLEQPHWLNCKQADTGVQSVASLVSLAKTETIYLSSPAKNPPSWRSFRLNVASSKQSGYIKQQKNQSVLVI